MQNTADIGLIGLAVMGQNLVLNIADHGYRVSVYNRTAETTRHFITDLPETPDTISPAYSIEDFVHSLSHPRKIILMVKAGDAVDAVIRDLVPLLDSGDIIIDGGNSFFKDTIRRTHELHAQGILFVGSGISGGEEGARFGPSIMPGGNAAAWPHIQPVLQDIAALNSDGSSCCSWIGNDGAGHYVKMIHNGIEYGDMQILSESYHIMHRGMGLSHNAMHDIYSKWNTTELDSYLVEITRNIMKYTDTDGSTLLTKIRDSAGQKGTGKWTGISACELNTPVTLITEAVFARFLSSRTELRRNASSLLHGPENTVLDNNPEEIEKLRKAVLAAKIISYTQGFMLMQQAADEYKWNLDYAGIARIWRNGCIIKSVFLDKISDAYTKQPDLQNLLFAPYFAGILNDTHQALRDSCAAALRAGIPVPALSSALSFYDALRSTTLPANVIQAQRDYFGAHLYERTDKPEGEFFHTEWKKPL